MNYDGQTICGVDDRLGSTGRMCKWNTTVVSWHVSFVLPGISDLDVKGAFETAFSYWAEVCGIVPRYASTPSAVNIVAGSGGIDGPSGTLAWSEMPCGNAQRLAQKYDDGEAWVIASNPPPTKIDLVRVACHEIGHAIGIPHIGSGNLMQPTYDRNIRMPQVGDRAEAVARYGVKNNPKPDPGEPTAPPWSPCRGILGLGEGCSQLTAILTALESAVEFWPQIRDILECWNALDPAGKEKALKTLERMRGQ